MKVAIITPLVKEDYLTNTILDGLRGLGIDFAISSRYPCRFDVASHYLTADAFTVYAQEADLVIFCWGKNNTDNKTAERVNVWDKTIFVDGSEVGGNKRYDFTIQKALLDGTYEGQGAIDQGVFARVPIYVRREKPYKNGIIPFPFGIDSRYLAAYNPSVEKDIDFVCLFGQDEYPPLRRYARELLEHFCKENGFTYATARVEQDEFYTTLARSKVGISVGGGGFDTARFWELLGNNCLVLTETIDIYDRDSDMLKYDRIKEFNNLYDFEAVLAHMGEYLRQEYDQAKLTLEYEKILEKHSSKARVGELLALAKAKGILR